DVARVALVPRISDPCGADRLHCAQRRPGEIVVAGAVADAVAAAVESRQRHDEEIGMNLASVALRLADSPLAALQLLAEHPGAKRKRSAARHHGPQCHLGARLGPPPPAPLP